jgi:hypothetical protein
VKEWAGKVGLKTPEDAAKKAYNLEKLLGHEKAGRTIVLPKDDADPKEQAEFYAKLGRPEKPEEYELPGAPEIAGEYAKAMHVAGITKKQAAILAETNNTIELARVKQLEERSNSDFESLKQEWGGRYDANLELAKRAVQDAGLTPEDITAIEVHLGPKKTANLFAHWGKKTTEHTMITGRGESFSVTPVQATAKIAALKEDKTWVAGYLQGEKAKVDEMAQLIKIANAG